MDEQRLCKYCGKPVAKTSKGWVCSKCKDRKLLVSEFYKMTEPLREVARERKARGEIE